MQHPKPAANLAHAAPIVSTSALWKLSAYALMAIGVLRLAASVEHAPYRNDFAH
jgi:hypothetical protein